jgi:hypothetical protein
MAKWLLYLRSDGRFGALYANTYTGVSERLGELTPDTPEDMIIKWVLSTERWRPGDILQFPSGRQLFFLNETGIA